LATYNLNDITNKQIYFWWNSAIQKKYQKNKNPVDSAIILLREQFQAKGCILLMSTNTNTLTAVAFSSPCLAYLKDVSEIHVDATYKTAKGRFELYAIIGQFQGTGFALGYLILDMTQGGGELNVGKTTILTEFFSKFKDLGLTPRYVFSDKDFAQINAAKNVWPNAHVQLCLWHIKRSILTKMKSGKKQEKYRAFTNIEMEHLDFVDRNFCPSNDNVDIICPAQHQNDVLALVERHFNLHPLIPIGPEGLFLTSEEIWKKAVWEIYQFCHANGYAKLWNYLFFSWYTQNRWNLWARSSNPTIPFGKTNMLVESHWKVLKHDYLYRFNRPRLDYVVFILCESLFQHNGTLLSIGKWEDKSILVGGFQTHVEKVRCC